MIVHQLLPSFVPGDAMSAAAIGLRLLLRRLGHAGEVFAGEVAPGFGSLVRPARALRSGSCDLVLYHHGIASPLAGRMLLWRGPFGVVFHNITPARFYAGTRLEEPLRSGRAQLAALATRAAVGIGVSDLNARELTAAGFPKVTVVPLFVESARFDHERADADFARRLADGGRPLVLAVGRVVPHKRVEDLLSLHAELRAIHPQARLLIVGKGAKGQAHHRALEARARALGGVTFSGPLAHAELVAAYRTADVYVSMSEHEGFGVPLVEAMAAELPVLAFGAAAVRETMGGHGLTFTEKRFASLAELVSLVVEDESLRARLIDGQRRRLDALSPLAAEQALGHALQGLARAAPAAAPLAPRRKGKVRPRLALVVQRYGETVTGGAEAHARMIAQRLSADVQVEVLTTTAKDHLTWTNAFTPGPERDGDVKVLRFRVERERRMRAFNRLSEERFAQGNDLVAEEHWLAEQGPVVPQLQEHLAREAHQYDAVAFFTYLYAPTAWGVPLVAQKALVVPTAHDEPPLRFDAFADVFERPRALLCNTPEEVELIRQRFPAAARTRVVGVGVKAPNARGARFAEKYGLTGSYLLYVGRREAGKGVGWLLELHRVLVKRFHDAPTLVLAGDGDLPARGERVRALGRISEQDKWDGLSGALAAVVPSQFESLSLLALEAFACGTPVVVNAASSVLAGHVARSGAGATFSDAEGYADAVRRVGAARKPLGVQALRYSRRFDWSAVLDAWREEIDRCRSGRGAARTG
ncbi:MAG: glycosyltransferase [Myxococcaceae bacterium]|nr:glycosyltransferase [Myxococcaceae bacterium]